MSKLDDLTGRRFGRLVVLKRAEDIKGKTAWECLCDCGNIKCVKASNLKRGKTRSCGCYATEVKAAEGRRRKKHGGFGTRLYRIYRGMWQRCYDKNVRQYSRYGGRGITICDEWMGDDGFENFRDWSLENGYSDTMSIDRIDNDCGYSPNNCRWATNKEQMNNRRNNVFLEVNGVRHIMAEWSDITGICRSTIKARHRAGWSDTDIITKNVDEGRCT